MKAKRRFSPGKRTAGFVASEILEDRTLLTGNVVATVLHGNLTIIGDAKANEIGIESTTGGLTGSRAWTAPRRSTAEYSPATFSGVTGNVSILMGKGNDVVSIGGGTMTTTFAHNLTIFTGDGNDMVSVSTASIGGNLTIFGGNGNDTFTVGSREQRQHRHHRRQPLHRWRRKRQRHLRRVQRQHYRQRRDWSAGTGTIIFSSVTTRGWESSAMNRRQATSTSARTCLSTTVMGMITSPWPTWTSTETRPSRPETVPTKF